MNFPVFKLRNTLRVLLLTGVAVGMCGCNVEKLADQMESHESHFPTGHQEAQGGVNYSVKGSTRDWSRTVFTCRSSVAGSGVATMRFGSSSGDLPLTITTDSAGPSTLQLESPDGVVKFDRASCSALKSEKIPDGAATAVPGSTGYITFDCSSGGKSVLGAVKFHQCAD